MKNFREATEFDGTIWKVFEKKKTEWIAIAKTDPWLEVIKVMRGTIVRTVTAGTHEIPSINISYNNFKNSFSTIIWKVYSNIFLTCSQCIQNTTLLLEEKKEPYWSLTNIQIWSISLRLPNYYGLFWQLLDSNSYRDGLSDGHSSRKFGFMLD